MIEIPLRTSRRCQMLDVTSLVAREIPKGFDGLLCAYVPHTTAGITINECADPSVREDILTMLQKLVPAAAGYSHTEGNADAHIKASLVGSSVNVIVRGGNLLLGTWQAIFFCEFDGPRQRRILLELLPK